MTGELLRVLDRFAGLRVGCVGDVMLDRYVHGAVERISPEAPVPVLRVARETAMPGGAGNVVRNLAALGVSVRFVAAVGDDAAGAELQALLAESRDVEDSELVVDAGRRTTVKTRFLADGQQLLRTDDESTAALSPPARDAIARQVEAWRGACPVVILSDYAKGVLAGDAAQALIAAVRAQGGRVVVDPKGPDFSRYRDADVVTPNRRELALAAGAAVAPGTEADCARSLRERFSLGAVLVTLGRDGMLLVDGAGEAHALPAQAREVFDVSGAGDTVAAVLAAALAAGASLLDAAALANVAGGIVVGKVGTAVVRRAELASALRQRDRARTEDKVFDVTGVCERVEVWRRQGLRIGFTNGCFDLIHPGHVSLLAQAAAACDRLIVGLNTDASVARLKGPDRPVQPETARAAVLASIAVVDAVVAFAEDTPRALIEALRPDVLVKGADYALEEVVGADLVRGWGGRVLLARLEPAFSTSKTIAAMTSPRP